jgi:four helix bundle protein
VAPLAFEGLGVYQKAGALADEIRAEVKSWDRLDGWSAGLQLIRAADSVAANIAEGTGRWSARDQARFYLIARGSLHEVQQWLIRATARGLPLPDKARERANEIGRMLNGLIRSTNQKPGTRN